MPSERVCSFVADGAVSTDETVSSGGADALLRKSEGPHYASLWRRLAALLIDIPIILVVGVIVPGLTARVLLQLMGWELPAQGFDTRALWESLGIPSKLFVLSVFFLASGGLYYPLCQSSGWQATIGKRLVGVQVADYHHRRITLVRAFGRALAKWFLHLVGHLFVVSALTIALTRRKRGLHDFLARTTVIHGRPAPDVGFETWRIVVFFGLTLAIFFSLFLLVLSSATAGLY